MNRHTGFHPLDGALFLKAAGAPQAVMMAVLLHTAAWGEAQNRPDLAETYQRLGISASIRTPLERLLTHCDLRTSPTGSLVTVPERIAEVARRYGPSHFITRNLQEHFGSGSPTRV